MLSIYIMTAIITLLLIIVIIPISIELKAEYQNQTDGLLRLELRTIFIKYNKAFSVNDYQIEQFLFREKQEKNKPGGTKPKKKSKYALEFSSRLLTLFYRLFKKLTASIHIKTLEWLTVLGRDDAMETALLFGSLWALKGGFISLLTDFFPVHKINLQVNPVFNQNYISSQLRCRLRTRIVSSLIIGVWFAVALSRHILKTSSAK